jgi:hypothetical protein
VVEFEQLLKVFFAENGTKTDLLGTLTAAKDWARTRCQESLAVGELYAAGDGPFPERLPELQLTSRFLTDFYTLVGNWASWATSVVETWPDDLRQAQPEPDIITETVRRAAAGIQTLADRSGQASTLPANRPSPRPRRDHR